MADLEIQFYSSSGVNRNLDESRMLPGVSFEYLESGGMGQATIPIMALWEGNEYSMSPVVAGDTVKIWVNGETYPRYVGTVSEQDRSLGLSETLKLICFGPMERMNSSITQKQQIIHPEIADLTTFAEDIFTLYDTKMGTSYASTGDFSTPVGITLDTLTLDRTTFRQALNALFDRAAGSAVWGWEVNPSTGALRPYFRPRIKTIGWQKVVGQNVRLLNERRPLSDVINALQPLMGGDALFPNALGLVTQTSDGKPNAAFDYPLPAGLSANVLYNPSFETDYQSLIQPAGWTPSAGVGTGIARTGSQGALLTSSATSLSQLRHNSSQSNATKIVVGHTYLFAVWAREQIGGTAGTIQGKLEWIDSGGSTIGSAITFNAATDIGVSTDTTTGTWIQYPLVSGLPSGITSTTPSGVDGFKVTFTHISGGGIVIDDACLYDNAAATQPGWETWDPGDNLTNIEWAYDDGYQNAPYSVHMVAGSGTTSALNDNITLRPKNGGRAKISPGQQVKIGVWYKSPIGATTTPEITLIAFPKDSSGKDADGVVQYGPSGVAASGSPTSTWQEISMIIIGTESVDSIGFGIQMDSPGEVLFSSAYIRDNSAQGGYIAGGQFYQYTDVTDIALESGLSSAALSSITNYGRRESVVSFPGVQDLNADAISEITAYFNKYAVLQEPRKLDLDSEAVDFITPALGLLCRVSGVEESLADEWPVRAQYTWTGKLAVVVELADPAPILTAQIQKLASGGTATVAGGATTSGTSSNSTVASTMVGATSTTDGAGGPVPTPTAGQQSYDLKGDGTFRGPLFNPQSGTTYTATTNDEVVLLTNTASVNVTLPAASAYVRRLLYLMKATSGNLVATAAGSDTINGASSATSTTATGAALGLFSDGTSWYVLAKV